MPKARSARIPDDKWEAHKSAIRALYLGEKRHLEGEDGVVSLMRRRHDFNASPAQYETRFKKWAFHKNLKREDWETIGRVLRERAARDTSSDVYFRGELIPDAKIQKEIARYKLNMALDVGEEEALPDGVTIIDNQGNTTLSGESTSSADDPEETTPMEPASPRMLVGTPLTFWDPDPFESTLLSSHITFPDSFEDGITIDWSAWDTLLESAAEIMPKWLPARLPTDCFTLVQGGGDPLTHTMKGRTAQALDMVRPCMAKMLPVLSRQAQQSLQKSGSEKVVVDLMLHILMNNFVGSEGTEFQAVLQLLKNFSMKQAQMLMDAIPNPFSTALQQSILTVAIKYGAISIVKALMAHGLKVDQMSCQVDGAPVTPLQYACKRRQIELVRLLLSKSKKADDIVRDTITKLFRGDSAQYPREKTFPQPVRDILPLLLKAGAQFGSDELCDGRFWRDDSLVKSFLEYGKVHKTVNPSHFLDDTGPYILHHRSDLEAVKCFALVLRPGFRFPPDGAGVLFKERYHVLQLAASLGHTQVVRFFLAAGLQPTALCLAGAIEGNSMDIVKRFLALGVKPNDAVRIHKQQFTKFAFQLPTDVDPLLLGAHPSWFKARTTPFAEAIRWQRHEMVSLFQSIGADNSLLSDDPFCFGFAAALDGAAEAGNFAMTLALLQERLMRDDRSVTYSPPSMSSTLTLATLADQEAIVLLLLDAGVRPNVYSLSIAVALRNRHLIRLFLDIGVDVGWNGNPVWLAVRWGDVNVLKDLLSAGALVNDYAESSPVFTQENPSAFPDSLLAPITNPLGEALRSGNRSAVDLLLQHGAAIGLENAQSKRYSAFAIAVQSGDEQMVRDMLARGADPDDSQVILEAASKSFAMLHIIIKALEQIDPSGKKTCATRALRQAIRDRNLAQASLLARYSNVNSIEKGHRDVQEMQSMGAFVSSAFGVAIASQNEEMVQILLGNGGDPNSTVTLQRYPPARKTALLEAVETKNLGIVELIHDAGAEVNVGATLGIVRTPLQVAIELGSFEIAECLIRNGADVNADPCIFAGGTALQLAAIKGYVGLAELLISRGADLNAPHCRYQGRTAFEGAAEHGRLDMLLFLYHNGVDLISDGGEQLKRASEFAKTNGQFAAKSLVEQISQALACGNPLVLS